MTEVAILHDIGEVTFKSRVETHCAIVQNYIAGCERTFQGLG